MMRRLGLGHRFALASFLVGVVLISALVLLQTRRAQRDFLARTQVSSDVIVDALSSLCQAHLVEGDLPILKRELQSIVLQNRLAYIDVYGPDGRAILKLLHPNRSRAATPEFELRALQGNVLDFSRPLT